VDSRVQQRQDGLDFNRMVGGLGSTADANKEMASRKQQFADLSSQLKMLRKDEEKAFKERWKWQDVPGREGDFAIADANHAAVQQKITELLKERKKLEEEIAVISKKSYELNDKALRDRTEKDRQAALERKKAESELQKKANVEFVNRLKDDNKTAQQITEQALGMKRDPTEGLAIPPAIKRRLGLLLSAEQATPNTMLADVATANSQSALRAQYMAKEAARANQQREQHRKLLEDILKTLREQGQLLEGVNLN
jgi:hypothetical protein